MATILLAGDIGGTKTILSLVRSEAPETVTGIPQQTTLFEETYSSQAFPDLVPMIKQFLSAAETQLGQSLTVAKACFGIAGPVVANQSELTNLSWSLQGDRLASALAIPRVKLINDFVAVGYGVLGLAPTDLNLLQDVPLDPQGAIAVLGAGTGLGECYLVPQASGRYQVFASEGSHADFAPRSQLEFHLLSYLRERYQLERVSVERVVSGLGIASIYEFLRDYYPEQESPKFAELYHVWQQELGKTPKTVDLSASVSQAALNGSDSLAEQAMKLFIEAYGAEAGNLALKLLPYGGLYVAGGIAPKILPLLQGGGFMKAFTSKGRMGDLMETIPVRVVLNPKVGLIGAAICAAQT